MSRPGKIARLPRELRDQLNRRLDDGESGVRLVEWLNGLPEAQKVMQAEFGGRRLTEQNLSEWKARGYREWLARQEMLAQAREVAADAMELAEATGGRLTDHLATLLAARYAAAMAGWNGEASEEFSRKVRTLRSLCMDIAELRRGDHSGARLQIERERLEREREKTEGEMAGHFKKWLKNPQIRDCLCQDWISPEDRERRLCEILGVAPKTAPAVPSDAAESGSTQEKSG